MRVSKGAAVRRGAVLEQEDALQVPSCSRPSVTGMLSWVWVSALLIWAGMSSGPSSLWAPPAPGRLELGRNADEDPVPRAGRLDQTHRVAKQPARWEARRYADFDISPNRRARHTDYLVNDDNSVMKIANFNGVGGNSLETLARIGYH